MLVPIPAKVVPAKVFILITVATVSHEHVVLVPAKVFLLRLFLLRGVFFFSTVVGYGCSCVFPLSGDNSRDRYVKGS